MKPFFSQQENEETNEMELGFNETREPKNEDGGSSVLSNPDEWTRVNSTEVANKENRKMAPQESSIEEEPDFEDSYDDSFILRAKTMETVESGFESANTISFDQGKNEDSKAGTGIMKLIQWNKKPMVNGIHFKILQCKVSKDPTCFND